MAQLDRSEVLSELNRLRKAPKENDAEGSPAAAWLRALLSNLTDSEDRYFVYHSLGAELRMQGDVSGALECARIRLAEFGDCVSRGVFARALLDLGRDTDAIEEFKKAFHSAIENNELVNYTFGELMRAAVNVGDLKTIENVSQEFLALRRRKSNGDCRLEVDWMDAAETQGASRALIEKLRRRAGQ